MKNDLSKKSGFTIIELLVASAIFVTFLVVAVGSFTRVLQVQRTLARRIVMTSALEATIESIAREIRIGQEFTPLNATANSISFKSFSTHAIDPSSISYTFDVGTIKKTDSVYEGSVTPSNVIIKNGTFIVSQKDSCQPWRITIALSAIPAGSGMDKPEERVNMQTTVTSRILPVDIKGDPYRCKSM